MKDEAQAVVIGGGVGGCSILYHLAKLGWRDVVLVEQYGLTHGSTWHSAGLVGQLRSTVSLTKMMQYSVGLYADLARETGKDPGWHQLGGLRLASSRERYEEIQRQAGWAKSFGLEMELVSPAEAQAMFPPMSTDGVVAAAFIPLDGYLDPSQLTFALADGARLLGADIEQRTRVTGINLRNGRVHEVVTDRGTIRTDVVVNAGGMYAPQIGRMVGAGVPIITYGHEFLLTEAFDPPLQPLPTLRDPDRLVYFRTEVGGLIMGGYERNPAPWALDGVPDSFEAQLLPETGPFDPLIKRRSSGCRRWKRRRCAALQWPRGVYARRGVYPRRVRRARFWVAAGFCAHGIAGAGGMGRMMAEWIVEGKPSLDLWHMDSRRFGRQYRSRDYTLARHLKSTPPTTTSSIRTTSAWPAGRCGSRPSTVAWRSWARASARSRAGSGPTGSSRTPPRATRACGRGAGPAGTGRRRSRPRHRHPRARGALRRNLVRQDRGHRPRRRRVPAAAMRQRHRPAVAPSPTPRCSTAAAVSSATSPSPGWPRLFRIVTGTAFGDHDWPGSATTCPTTAR